MYVEADLTTESDVRENSLELLQRSAVRPQICTGFAGRVCVSILHLRFNTYDFSTYTETLITFWAEFDLMKKYDKWVIVRLCFVF